MLKRVKVIPVMHNSATTSATLFDKLVELNPKFVFIECGKNDLTDDSSGDDDIKACKQYKKGSLIAVDIPQKVTRRSLMSKLLFHPIETVALRKAIDREEMAERCPNAFQVLFADREKFMAGKVRYILEHANEATLGEVKTAESVVVCGAAHGLALERLLASETDSISIEWLRDANRLGMSPLPLIFLFYVLLPLVLIGPWPYYVAYRIRESRNNESLGEKAV